MTHSRIIGIAGLGLIGGSIARALKRNTKGYVIHAYDRQEANLDLALKEGIIDKKCQIEELSLCEVVFICVPVYKMEKVLKELKPVLKSRCILTDVGSTKGDVAALIKKLDLNNRFIGGHPLTGSEKSGYSASKANLFENAYYCLTPYEKTRNEDMAILKEIVSDMGAIPCAMTSEVHDRAAAVISHVPHVIAALLVNLVGEHDGQDNLMKTLAAGGFKDITRIASSSPELWSGICLSNKEIILNTLYYLTESLEKFEDDLRNERKSDINEFFVSARSLRSGFSDIKGLIQKTYAIIVDVDDRPGIIAVIASALAKEGINIKNIGILNSRETEEGALQIQFEDAQARQQGIRVLNSLGYSAREKE